MFYKLFLKIKKISYLTFPSIIQSKFKCCSKYLRQVCFCFLFLDGNGCFYTSILSTNSDSHAPFAAQLTMPFCHSVENQKNYLYTSRLALTGCFFCV